MRYKVCILAAGRGSRVSTAAGINKALLPVDSRAMITRILDWFPHDVEAVIAVGHEAEKVQQFVDLAMPLRRIKYIPVDNISGPGAGPGYSLLCCRDELQCPFVLVACDTLVLEPVPQPKENWIGIDKVSGSESFLVAEMSGDRVVRLFDKMVGAEIERAGASPSEVCKSGFIGLAGINDYLKFWEGLAGNDAIKAGERQTSNGLESLLDDGIRGYPFTWFDTGTDENYHATAQQLGSTHFLEKPGEFVYFEYNRVIKFFSDATRAENRVCRAAHLDGVVPEIVGNSGHYLAYRFVPGSRLSDVTDPAVFRRFLEFAMERVWKPLQLTSEQEDAFREASVTFYRDKTEKRVAEFFSKMTIRDSETIINGDAVPSVRALLDQVDWDALTAGVAVPFHGDAQPENIIVTNGKGGEATGNEFVMVDWREEFGGLLEFGDFYYDLGKLHHALIITGEVIRDEQYQVSVSGHKCDYEYRLRSHLLYFLKEFEAFIEERGFDLWRVRLITALIYLNIAPLHHFPYDQLLFYHGKYTLHKVLHKEWVL